MNSIQPRSVLRADPLPSWHARHPELGRGPVPVEPYLSEAHYAKEIAHVFRKHWLFAGRVEEIPTAGDYLVKDFHGLKASIIVVRDNDGQVVAMHNVCSHRQNKLVWDKRGQCALFRCKYHGWNFRLNGELRGVPQEDRFFDLDRSACGLSRVAVGVWAGFIFINLDPNPQLTLAEFMSDTVGELESYPFGDRTECYTYSGVVKCNWKVALDNFQEAYHASYVHGLSLGPAAPMGDNGVTDMVCGRHHRKFSFTGDQAVPFNSQSQAADDPSSLAALAASPRPISGLALQLGRGQFDYRQPDQGQLKGLNWSQDPNWIFDINIIFPNVWLNMRPDRFGIQTFTPIDHRTTAYEARFYHPRPTNAGGRFYQEYLKCAFREVALEDFACLERVQESLESRAKPVLHFQEAEIFPRHNLHVIARAIREGEAA